jgi:hypothetical protein|tara:strand:+ start:667 stop:1053 length:387 start_codon:yes stop_codon:yes gene_type:complete
MFEEIKKIGKYFYSLRQYNELLILDLKLPKVWEAEKLAQFYGEKVQFKLGDSSDTAQLVSLYAEFTGEGLNNLLKTSENIIKWNRDREEKRELLEQKRLELEKIFESNKVESLRDLDFNFKQNEGPKL